MLSLVAGVVACGRPAVPSALREDPGFRDYSEARVESVAELLKLAAAPSGGTGDAALLAGAKFVITDFSDPTRRRIHYLDGRYYRFHDEWAWFRLLNGQPVSGMAPLEPHAFAAPEQARRWAFVSEDALPSGLEITDGRLYARAFYDLSLADDERPLGAGSLVHVAARGERAEVWGFEVDYTDPVGEDELLVFFHELQATMPREGSSRLKWIARSPSQLEVGRRLMAAHPELTGRVMTYADVSVSGETAVYTAGIVAGRLRAFRDLSRLAEAEPEDILVLGALPEYLPQARGMLTAIPQTPLAHLNLLAKSRQIVNAYRGGLFEDPEVQDLLRSRAPVVVSAEQGQLHFRRITEQQYRAWHDSVTPMAAAAVPVDARSAPYTIDLSRVTLDELPKLAPLIGGKGVGMAELVLGMGPGTQLNGAGVLHADVPDRPLVLSIRAYREHLAPLLPTLRALFADQNFRDFKKLRVLALEGAAEFCQRFPGRRDRQLADSYLNPRAPGPIALVVRQGGVASMVRHRALPGQVKAELERVLPQHFASYSSEQGLRFRSSSTVEDIEGFNGAGLYDSSTGFLVPRPAQGKEPKRPSVADAVRKTWASYFRFEAFEERHQQHIDHLAADMAVLVHARFDDALELANGVFTFTLAPDQRELHLDAQPGAVSVTNPPTDRVVIPESSEVTKTSQGLVARRHTKSSLLASTQQVLTDAELRELYGLAEALTEKQLVLANRGLPKAQQRTSLVLDFEFRRVGTGWPALATQSGEKPSRLVIKQMRPLEPSAPASVELARAPVPRDVLARARRIETRECRAPGVELTALLVWTEPEALPNLGYVDQPLLAGLGITLPGATSRVFTHLELARSRIENGGLRAELRTGLGLSRVVIDGTSATLSRAGREQRVEGLSCTTRLERAEPRELLRSYLQAPR